jgi:hypothetical protein
MNPLQLDVSKLGPKWLAYFDLLGFANYVENNNFMTVFHQAIKPYYDAANEESKDFGNVQVAWFSDTVLFYSADDSQAAFSSVSAASRSFFDELLLSEFPVRGALAFGELYPDKEQGVFIGKALVDAHKYGEKFDWIGFVLHPTAVDKMLTYQSVSQGTYKSWDAPLRPQTERVFAYLFGGSHCIRPVEGSNPYLAAIEAMSARACERHKSKYTNTTAFLNHFLRIP